MSNLFLNYCVFQNKGEIVTFVNINKNNLDSYQQG